MEREDPPLVKMTPKKSDSEQENPSEKPLLLRLALLYSLLSAPLGHVYCGRIRRGFIVWLIVFIVGVVSYSCVSTLAVGRFGFVLLMLVIVGSGVFLHADALLVARRCQRNPRKRYQRWWFYWIFFVSMNLLNWVCIVGVRTFVAETFRIAVRSGMAPTLQLGDRLYVDKLWFSPQGIKRNALVVYRNSGTNYSPYIKRVIGLPGEVIEIKDEVIYVNGEKWLDEYGSFTGKPISAYPELVNCGPVVVPWDCYYLIGDNRRNSYDSRVVGPIPQSDIVGVANMIYWSRETKVIHDQDGVWNEQGAIAWNRIGKSLK